MWVSGTLLATPPVAVVLATATNSPELPSWVGTAVTPVIVLGAIFAKLLVPGWVHNRVVEELTEEKAENAKLQDKLDRVNAGVIDTTLPAVLKGTAAIEQVTPVLSRIVNILDTRTPPIRGGE